MTDYCCPEDCLSCRGGDDQPCSACIAPCPCLTPPPNCNVCGYCTGRTPQAGRCYYASTWPTEIQIIRELRNQLTQACELLTEVAALDVDDILDSTLADRIATAGGPIDFDWFRRARAFISHIETHR